MGEVLVGCHLQLDAPRTLWWLERAQRSEEEKGHFPLALGLTGALQEDPVENNPAKGLVQHPEQQRKEHQLHRLVICATSRHLSDPSKIRMQLINVCLFVWVCGFFALFLFSVCCS